MNVDYGQPFGKCRALGSDSKEAAYYRAVRAWPSIRMSFSQFKKQFSFDISTAIGRKLSALEFRDWIGPVARADAEMIKNGNPRRSDI